MSKVSENLENFKRFKKKKRQNSVNDLQTVFQNYAIRGLTCLKIPENLKK